MLIIANNITTRNPKVAALFRNRISGRGNGNEGVFSSIQNLAQSCIKAGADVLEVNLQQHFDCPEEMEYAVKAIQKVTDRQICLSCNRADTLEAGLKLCQRPPVVNYVTTDASQLQGILPLVKNYSAELVMLISDPVVPADARQMLEKAAALVGVANEAGIPNERIFLDPGIFHITKEQGQHHLVEVMELLEAIPETFDPQVRTTCWIGNSSAGASPRLRPVIETTLLALLSGIGLSAVFLDVLKRENRRAVRLLKIFNNDEIYADGDLAL